MNPQFCEQNREEDFECVCFLVLYTEGEMCTYLHKQ